MMVLHRGDIKILEASKIWLFIENVPYNGAVKVN